MMPLKKHCSLFVLAIQGYNKIHITLLQFDTSLTSTNSHNLEQAYKKWLATPWKGINQQ